MQVLHASCNLLGGGCDDGQGGARHVGPRDGALEPASLAGILQAGRRVSLVHDTYDRGIGSVATWQDKALGP